MPVILTRTIGLSPRMEAFITHQEPLPKLAEGHSSELAEAFLNLVEVEYRRHRNLSYYANKLCKSARLVPNGKLDNEAVFYLKKLGVRLSTRKLFISCPEA